MEEKPDLESVSSGWWWRGAMDYHKLIKMGLGGGEKAAVQDGL